MSDNQGREVRDFSKYDAMATDELENILRLDAEAPEGAESDTELLLYIMEVLVERNKATGITGNDAHSAWKSFQENYMPKNTLDISEKRRRPAAPWVRRLAAAAAVVALVVIIPVSANALSFEKLWDIFARWAKETFSFVSGEETELSEPTPEHKDEYYSLQELLEACKHRSDIIPTWIPDGYVLDRITQNITPTQEIYLAFYLKDNDVFKIRVQTYLSEDIFSYEIEEGNPEILSISGVEYYIIDNVDQIQVIWINDIYECVISGDLSIEEAKMMVNSIGKG